MKDLKNFVKEILHAADRKRREILLSNSEPHTTDKEITKGLRNLGIGPGDIVFVHSSLKSIGFVEGGADAVIEALWQAVQPGGTLVLPTFYMLGTILNTCQDPNYIFDARKLSSNLGALPKAFLRRPNVQRSIHPTHSVSALGPHAKIIVSDHHLASSTFGANSPWHRFTELNGKLLGLGVSMGPITYYHHLEDMLGDSFPIDIWLPEVYRLQCIDLNGDMFKVPVRPFRPELLPSRIDHPSQSTRRDQMRTECMNRGLLTSGVICGASSWWMNAQPFYSALADLAKNGRTIWDWES